MGSYYHTRESVDEYTRMAKGYDGGKIIQKLRTFLPDGSRVLEIGSGPGTDWKILDESFRVIGSDNSLEFLKRLQKTHSGGEFLELDAETIKTDQRFDAIYSNKVLHHLNDDALENSIARQKNILHPGGIVCHTFWNGEDSEVYNDLFVNYHTDAGIQTLFGKQFDHLYIHHYQEFEKGDSIIYMGKKK